MNPNLNFLRRWFCRDAVVFLAALASISSCFKKEAAPAAAAEPKPPENIVMLSAANLANMQIKVEIAKLGNLETKLAVAGRVSENANKTAKVVSTMEGRLIKLNSDLTDRVQADEIIALVQTPELLGKLLEVKAPIDGVVTERKSTAGESITKDTPLYVISDPTNLWVLAEIKERDIGQVKAGQEAVFSVLSYPGEKFRGRVALIGSSLDQQSRTLEVRLETRNEEGKLKPGMFADVEITTTAVIGALLISDAAVQKMGEAQVVFVPLGQNKFEKRVVKFGAREGADVQVLSGLKEGEKVVTEGSFILKSQMLKGEMGEKD